MFPIGIFGLVLLVSSGKLLKSILGFGVKSMVGIDSDNGELSSIPILLGPIGI